MIRLVCKRSDVLLKDYDPLLDDATFEAVRSPMLQMMAPPKPEAADDFIEVQAAQWIGVAVHASIEMHADSWLSVGPTCARYPLRLAKLV